jgi:hypothetical protein
MPDFSTRVKALYFGAWIGLFSGVEPLICFKITTKTTESNCKPLKIIKIATAKH